MTDDIEELINDIMQRESQLSEWEHNFMQSISETINITRRQREIIERIWENVTL